jgi:hypothetical protein
MNKFYKLLSVLVIFSAIAGCDNGGTPPAASTRTDSNALTITLGPETSQYPLDDVFKGDIQFAVSVENVGDSIITFAHPVICFPEGYKIGDSLNFREYHGKSEILLTVEKPDGDILVLRDGPHFFDPDSESHFTLRPGGSDLFYIGWFFQNARGGWEDNIRAETVFTGRGQYRLTLLYRNFFPKALIHDNASEKSNFADVWTGEIKSNTITVTVE